MRYLVGLSSEGESFHWSFEMFESWIHPSVSRRTAVQVGATGILGLGMNHLGHLRSAAAASSQNNKAFGKAKSCIYIFKSSDRLTGR